MGQPSIRLELGQARSCSKSDMLFSQDTDSVTADWPGSAQGPLSLPVSYIQFWGTSSPAKPTIDSETVVL